MTEITLN